jgi:hypothetical protein
MTIKRVVEGDFDVSTATITTVETTYEVRGVITNIDATIAQGTLTQFSSRTAIIQASDLAIVPNQSDKLVVGEVDYRILSVTPIDPGGIQLCYKLNIVSGLQTIIHRESPA